MNNAISGYWVPFSKPIRYRFTTTAKGIDEGWFLAWRPCYAPQPKAFETPLIDGIEYLDSNGDIFFSENIEFVDNPGGEQ